MMIFSSAQEFLQPGQNIACNRQYCHDHCEGTHVRLGTMQLGFLKTHQCDAVIISHEMKTRFDLMLFSTQNNSHRCMWCIKITNETENIPTWLQWVWKLAAMVWWPEAHPPCWRRNTDHSTKHTTDFEGQVTPDSAWLHVSVLVWHFYVSLPIGPVCPLRSQGGRGYSVITKSVLNHGHSNGSK